MRTALLEQRVKQLVRRTIGEPYVGKRLKLRRLAPVLRELDLTPGAILDAGSEDATFVYWLADRFPSATVTAVDLDEGAIEACRIARPKRYAERVSFEATAFADLPEGSFGLVTALDVLEHIDDDRTAVADLARALRPGGSLLVHVPTAGGWTTWSGTHHPVADEDAWRINAGHVRSGYSPTDLRSLLSGAGLDVRRVESWTGRWGAAAFAVYAHLERPVPLRLLTLPVSDVCAALDGRDTAPGGNTVFAHAVRPG